jgi:lysophospholipase L1-like esterase
MTPKPPEPKPPEEFQTVTEMEAEARSGATGDPHGDDSLMQRFDRWNLSRFSAGDSVKAIALTSLLLLLFAGGSVRAAADELDPGIGRDIIKAVGEPTGWIADQLPFAETRRDLTSWLSPDEELGEGGFDQAASPDVAPASGGGDDQAGGGELETVLVTGDSLSTPLDIEIAQDLADSGIEVIRDPHLGTGISNTGLVDWGQLSTGQVSQHEPDAVVVFIGANEGYPLPAPSGAQVGCCGPEWSAEFESRVGQMMDTYLQDGSGRVYWLTVPTQRDPARAPINETVNAAIEAAAAERGDAVEVIDTVPTFTPGGRYRDAMPVDGEEQIVRESDGIHLNDVGSELAAELVLAAVDEDFDR